MRFVERLPATRLVASAVGVFGVFVLCVAYMFSSVLDTPLTSRPRDIRVELAATGGLFEGSVVTYRGVKIGKVTSIDFTPTGVEAIARVTSDDQIPANTRAVVRSLSPVGEQYLDFQPSGTAGPYLHDGSRIAATATDVPRTLAATVISMNKLLRQIDPDELHTVLEESSVALRGTSDDLARLTSQGQDIVADLDRLWPHTDSLLVHGGTVLDIGTDNAGTLTRTVRDLRAFASFLKAYDPELRKALDRAPGQVATLGALLDDARKVLPTFLRLGADVTSLVASYEPHLRVLLQEFAPGLGVLAGAEHHGQLWLDVIGQKDHVCSYGTPAQDPKSTTTRPLQTDKGCAGSWPWMQRGAAHAPGPVR